MNIVFSSFLNFYGVVLKKIDYRPQLDGLRAVAVIAVIIYHANITVFDISFFPGGYLGVDVFFVLSGYLITKIVASSLESNEFSYKAFYLSRAKRIVPALFFVLCVVSILAYYVLLPQELFFFSESLKSALFFLSNFYFSAEDSYDAVASIYKPLLHTWSLGVEWQFYLLFPLLLSLLYSLSKKYCIYFIVVSAVLSLVYASWLVENDANSAFFLLPSRAWELLCGGFIAQLEVNKHSFLSSDKFRALSRFLPFISIVAIITSLVFVDHSYSHPSWITFLPVLSTMSYILFSNDREITHRLLGWKPVVFIGLISYSLYLWHQPLLVLYRFNFKESIELIPFTVLFILTFFLSVLTYHLVEKPFRARKINIVQRGAVVVAFSALYLASVFVINSHGMPNRLGPLKSLFYSMNDRKTFKIDGQVCHSRAISKSCYEEGNDKDKGTIVLIGDSHAATLSKNLYEGAIKRGYGYRQFTPGGCMAIESVEMHRILKGVEEEIDACSIQSRQIAEFVKEHNKEKLTIVYASRLPLYTNGTRYDNGEGGIEQGEKYWVEPADPTQSLKGAVVEGLNNWVDSGAQLILVYPIPEAGWNVKYEAQRALQVSRSLSEKQKIMDNLDLSTSYENYLVRTEEARNILDSVPDVALRVYPDKIFCADGERCITHSKRKLYYYDDDHLSTHGAKLVVADIFEQLDAKDNEANGSI